MHVEPSSVLYALLLDPGCCLRAHAVLIGTVEPVEPEGEKHTLVFTLPPMSEVQWWSVLGPWEVISTVSGGMVGTLVCCVNFPRWAHLDVVVAVCVSNGQEGNEPGLPLVCSRK